MSTLRRINIMYHEPSNMNPDTVYTQSVMSVTLLVFSTRKAVPASRMLTIGISSNVFWSVSHALAPAPFAKSMPNIFKNNLFVVIICMPDKCTVNKRDLLLSVFPLSVFCSSSHRTNAHQKLTVLSLQANSFFCKKMKWVAVPLVFRTFCVDLCTSTSTRTRSNEAMDCRFDCFIVMEKAHQAHSFKISYC